MYYTITAVSDEMIFIKWYNTCLNNTQPQHKFIHDLRGRLEAAAHPLYFLSDLRLGRIMDIYILQKLGQLTRHPNYGGGAAFSSDTLANMFVGVFSRFAEPEKGASVFYNTLEEARAYLESIKPGLTKGIDWQQFIARLDGHQRV